MQEKRQFQTADFLHFRTALYIISQFMFNDKKGRSLNNKVIGLYFSFSCAGFYF